MTADLLDGYLLLGSENGDLHLMNVSTVENGGYANTIPAHCMKINQIEHNKAKTIFYTSGLYDHSVLWWAVESHQGHPLRQDSLDHVCDLFN